MSSKASRLLLVLNFAIVYFVWGMTFIWMKIATKELHPFIIIFWQNILAAFCLILINKQKSFFVFLKKYHISIITQSFFTLICGVSFITISVNKLPASFASIIIASVPIWVTLLNGISERSISPRKIVSTILGFAGILFLLHSESTFLMENFFHLALLLLASLSWSFGLFRMNKLPIIHEPYLSSAAQMLVAAIFYFILIVMFMPEIDFIPIEKQTTISIFSLAILGSTLAFSSFNWLLKHSAPLKVSTYAYINPIVSIFMAWLFLGEKFKLHQVPYIVIILISVFVVVTDSNEKSVYESN